MGRRGWGGLVALLIFIALALTEPAMGLTDDAEAYLGASTSYARWAAEGPHDRTGTLAAFEVNHEHPPVAKYAMGASWWLLHARTGWLPSVSAARLGIIALAAWLAYLVFAFAWDFVGRTAAFAAPLLLFTMPRFFFHAHVETLDLAIAATSFFALTTFARVGPDRASAVYAGVAFGLALATKLNAPFLLPACALVVLARRIPGLLRTEEAPPRDLLALACMATIGPLLFLALWPWMWFHTGAHLAEYAGFHLRHYGILFYYFGKIYEDPFAPWHAPLVMTAITTPPVTLVLALVGGVLALRSHRPASWLIVLGAATFVGVAALPSVPRYGGVKLFLPLFPLLAVLAGWTVQAIVDRARLLRWKRGLAVAVTVLPALVGLALVHPLHLSYYNLLVGGLPGAVRVGFERQYYDLLYPKLLEWMNRSLPENNAVTFLPNNVEYLRNHHWWRDDGRIRDDLHFVPIEDAQVIVLSHERRWPNYPDLAARCASLPRLWELRLEGVPLVTVYRLRSDDTTAQPAQ